MLIHNMNETDTRLNVITLGFCNDMDDEEDEEEDDEGPKDKKDDKNKNAKDNNETKA